jgi:predicted nucleic acid-binding protein
LARFSRNCDCRSLELDTWIAATALANGADVWTRDNDFSDFAAAVTVVHV